MQKNNLEIVMIKAEFGLLTPSVASEEMLICEKPNITSEIWGSGGCALSYHGAMLLQEQDTDSPEIERGGRFV